MIVDLKDIYPIANEVGPIFVATTRMWKSEVLAELDVPNTPNIKYSIETNGYNIIAIKPKFFSVRMKHLPDKLLSQLWMLINEIHNAGIIAEVYVVGLDITTPQHTRIYAESDDTNNRMIFFECGTTYTNKSYCISHTQLINCRVYIPSNSNAQFAECVFNNTSISGDIGRESTTSFCSVCDCDFHNARMNDISLHLQSTTKFRGCRIRDVYMNITSIQPSGVNVFGEFPNKRDQIIFEACIFYGRTGFHRIGKAAFSDLFRNCLSGTEDVYTALAISSDVHFEGTETPILGESDFSQGSVRVFGTVAVGCVVRINDAFDWGRDKNAPQYYLKSLTTDGVVQYEVVPRGDVENRRLVRITPVDTFKIKIGCSALVSSKDPHIISGDHTVAVVNKRNVFDAYAPFIQNLMGIRGWDQELFSMLRKRLECVPLDMKYTLNPKLLISEPPIEFTRFVKLANLFGTL